MRFISVLIFFLIIPYVSFSGQVNIGSYTRKDGTPVSAYSYHRDSYTSNPIRTTIAPSGIKLSSDQPPFASETSPRLFNWIDEQGRHAVNEPLDVPKHIREKLQGQPDGTWLDENGILRDSKGRIKRSDAAKVDFQKQTPCPATKSTSGSCPGFIIVHVVPLKRGGDDSPQNMQWQTVGDAKAKDKWE
ncbi:MAG TPA: hypothetical protein VGL27_02860 [Negativicutes bacterium]|jgi:hypothetical protein